MEPWIHPPTAPRPPAIQPDETRGDLDVTVSTLRPVEYLIEDPAIAVERTRLAHRSDVAIDALTALVVSVFVFAVMAGFPLLLLLAG